MLPPVTAGFGEVGFCGYWTASKSSSSKNRVYPFVSPSARVYYHPVSARTHPLQQREYKRKRDQDYAL